MPDTQTADVIMRAGWQSSTLGRLAVICPSIHAWFRPSRCMSWPLVRLAITAGLCHELGLTIFWNGWQEPVQPVGKGAG